MFNNQSSNIENEDSQTDKKMMIAWISLNTKFQNDYTSKACSNIFIASFRICV